MTDFWRHSGYHLLTRRADGRLAVTDDFLRAYLERPEMRPVPESCDAERALHAALMANPREAVSPARLARLADAEARENYRVLLAFRDRLIAADTVEDGYLGLFREARVEIPPMFVDHLVHVVVRGMLEGADALRARAGEFLFRAQKMTIHEGRVMAADLETVEMYAASGGFGDLGRLLIETGTAPRRVDLDVLGEANADDYWRRDERHDTVLDVTFAAPGLDALARVLETWIRHFTDADTSIQPVASIRDERWVWHVGLDAEATAILNDLYNGADVDEERLARLLALFRL
ncbi:MAG: DUF6352 family protein, partial [Alphaproteobacteria bacterium]